MTTIDATKFIIGMLNQPASFGIQLNNQGWTRSDAMLETMKNYNNEISAGQLRFVVENDAKKRLELSDEDKLIRLSRTTIIEDDTNYVPAGPPEFLFHGTSGKASAYIQKQGLVKGERRFIHLAETADDAHKFGSVKGRPVVYKIKSGEMYLAGYQFYLAPDSTWLVDVILPEYIEQV